MTGEDPEYEAHYEIAITDMRIARRLARLNLENMFKEQGRSWVESDGEGNVVRREAQ